MLGTRTLAAGIFFVAMFGCAATSTAETNYSLMVEAPREVALGQAAKAVVRLVAKGQWKVNKLYPLKLKLKVAEGVDVPKMEMNAGDGLVSDKEVKLEIPFTVKAGGPRTVTGELRFSVCAADKCDIKKELITWTTKGR